MGCDAEGDAVSFIPPTCTVYRHHIGGEKPLPPMVPLTQHVGALACTNWDVPRFRTMRQGGREEAPTSGGGVVVR